MAQQKDTSRWNRKGTWCNKRWYRGEIGNILAQQKMRIVVNKEISWSNKKGYRDEHGKIVKGRTFSPPFLKATRYEHWTKSNSQETKYPTDAVMKCRTINESAKNESLVTNTTFERAKSKFVVETKAAVKFRHKVRGKWRVSFLTRAGGGRG